MVAHGHEHVLPEAHVRPSPLHVKLTAAFSLTTSHTESTQDTEMLMRRASMEHTLLDSQVTMSSSAPESEIVMSQSEFVQVTVPLLKFVIRSSHTLCRHVASAVTEARIVDVHVASAQAVTRFVPFDSWKAQRAPPSHRYSQSPSQSTTHALSAPRQDSGPFDKAGSVQHGEHISEQSAPQTLSMH